MVLAFWSVEAGTLITAVESATLRTLSVRAAAVHSILSMFHTKCSVVLCELLYAACWQRVEACSINSTSIQASTLCQHAAYNNERNVRQMLHVSAEQCVVHYMSIAAI
jgi:hypothetical protein